MEQGFLDDEDCLQPAEFEKEIDSMVEDAFASSDKNADNKLSFEEFKRWMLNTPEIIGIVYSVFEMRGHVDTAEISRQFQECKQAMDEKESSEKVQELTESKRMVDSIAAKLLVENSQLIRRVRALEKENAVLKASSSSSKCNGDN